LSYYNYHCSEYRWSFDGASIELKHRPIGVKFMVEDTQHGSCASSAKKLSYDSQVRTVFLQENLYGCKDGFSGWSEPKKLVVR